jgi:hypothetical protein
MSIFSKILDKLGLGKDQPNALEKLGLGKHEHTATTSAPVAGPPKPATTAPTAKPAAPTATAAKPAAPAPTSEKGVSTAPSAVEKRQRDDVAVKDAPKEMSQVDVTNMLEQKAKGTGLNWKQSISDLLFLLEIDNSRAARTELAKELGAPEDVMSDSARMNTWLHKTVLKKIAENGGNIPQELLD